MYCKTMLLLKLLRALKVIFSILCLLNLAVMNPCFVLSQGMPCSAKNDKYILNTTKFLSVMVPQSISGPESFFDEALGVTGSPKMDVFLENFRRGGGHFGSKKLHCRFCWFQSGIFWVKKRNVISKKGGGAGPRIVGFWHLKCWAGLD